MELVQQFFVPEFQFAFEQLHELLRVELECFADGDIAWPLVVNDHHAPGCGCLAGGESVQRLNGLGGLGARG